MVFIQFNSAGPGELIWIYVRVISAFWRMQEKLFLHVRNLASLQAKLLNSQAHCGCTK